MCSQKRVGKHLLVNVDNKCQSSMVCGLFYDKFGHKKDPHISDLVRKLISIPIPTDRQNHMIPDDGRIRLSHL